MSKVYTAYHIYLQFLPFYLGNLAVLCVSIGCMIKEPNVVFSSLPGNSSMFVRHFVEPGFLLLPHLDVVFCKEFLQPAQLIKERNVLLQ
jgi:hypothetical protein